MSVSHPCPACGASIDFRSKLTVFAVCTYCSSTIARDGDHFEHLGKMAELLPDMSPLQIGTRGIHDKKAFELVGRLKVSWTDGTWNEWYALFEDGSAGWLAEAQGFWMMSFPCPDAMQRLPERLRLGAEVTLGPELRDAYRVSDIRRVTYSGSEGQLPFSGLSGLERTSLDLNGVGHDGFATVDVSDEAGTNLYVGSYVDLIDLQPTNLRQFEDWVHEW